jgi:hypothetical protein
LNWITESSREVFEEIWNVTIARTPEIWFAFGPTSKHKVQTGDAVQTIDLDATIVADLLKPALSRNPQTLHAHGLDCAISSEFQA